MLEDDIMSPTSTETTRVRRGIAVGLAALAIISFILAVQGYFVAATAVTVASLIGVGGVLWKGWARHPLTFVGAGLILIGLTLGMVSAAHADFVITPNPNPMGLTYDHGVYVGFYEDTTTDQRWVTLSAVTATAEVFLGGASDLWLYYGPTANGDAEVWVSDTPITERPISAGATKVDVQDDYDDYMDWVLANEMLGEGLYDVTAPGGCSLSCNAMRKASDGYQDAIDAEFDRLISVASFGMISGGVATIAGVTYYISTPSTVLFGGGMLTAEAFACLTGGLVLVGIGAAGYLYLTMQSNAAGSTWAADPANGCPGCGFEMGTYGWFYTGAGTDMCVNPACGFEGDLDGETGHQDCDGEDEDADAHDLGSTKPREPIGFEKEHWAPPFYGGGGVGGGEPDDDCNHYTGQACIDGGCSPGVVSCLLCTQSRPGCVYY